MFAKLFTTSMGQLLIEKVTSDEDGTDSYYGLRVRYLTQSPVPGTDAEVTKLLFFGDESTDMDDDEITRDEIFDEFDQDSADTLVAEGL